MKPFGASYPIEKRGRDHGNDSSDNQNRDDSLQKTGDILMKKLTPAEEGELAAKRENASSPSRATVKVRVSIVEHLGPSANIENIETAIRKGLENYGYKVNEVMVV